MSLRVFVAAGPGNIIQAHDYWRRGLRHPDQFNTTFSSQVEDYCKDADADVYMVSYYRKPAILKDGRFTLEHRPKAQYDVCGFRFHFSELHYALSLLATAIRFRADIAIIDSGTTHHFLTALFRLAGIHVVTVLHNTLWPTGFPPRSLAQRLIMRLDARFFRKVASATLGVSPECLRQVEQLTGGRHGPLYEFRAQYDPSFFAEIPSAPAPEQVPFRIMFVGRIMRYKGVFDILHIAKKVEARLPGRVAWDVCGTGPDLAELQRLHADLKLESVVSLRGWISMDEMRELLVRSHMAIVPTRGQFAEGMATTAVEPVLAGRPVLTCSIVPALEVMRPACVEALPEDIDSYADAVVSIVQDPARYRALCAACPGLAPPFYDAAWGLRDALHKAVREMLPVGGGTLVKAR